MNFHVPHSVDIPFTLQSYFTFHVSQCIIINTFHSIVNIWCLTVVYIWLVCCVCILGWWNIDCCLHGLCQFHLLYIEVSVYLSCFTQGFLSILTSLCGVCCLFWLLCSGFSVKFARAGFILNSGSFFRAMV